MITIVGLGVARGDLTMAALDALKGARRVVLRTALTPAALVLDEMGIAYTSLDELYEGGEDYDEVNNDIAKAVLCAAREGSVAFGVLGGAGLMDASVKAVTAAASDAGIDCEVIAGVGLYEHAAGDAGGLYGASIVAAIDVQDQKIDVRQPLIVCEIINQQLASDCKLALLEHYPAQHMVRFDGNSIALEDMDRQKNYTHLSTLVLPQLALEQCERYDFEHLMQIIRKLRAPDGCPWDREQTHASMKSDLIEEAYEVLDAIDSDDPYRLADELGDLLLHICMHAQIGSEYGEFDVRDVLWSVCNKMITRHPHVFGQVHVENTADVLRNWEAIKKDEKSLRTQTEVMHDIPRTFPALMRAAKVQKKANAVGFDWDDVRDALDKVHEETLEVEEVLLQPDLLAGELGDLLFSVVNVCRMSRIPPELALEGTTDKFIRRFSYVEQRATERGMSMENMTLDQMDALWDEIKAIERKKP